MHPIEPEPAVSFAPEDSDDTRPQGQLEARNVERIARGIEVHNDVLGRARNFAGRLDWLHLEQAGSALPFRREPVHGVRLRADAAAAYPIPDGAGWGRTADERARARVLGHLPEVQRSVWRNRERRDVVPEFELLFFDTLSAIVIAAADTAIFL